MQKQARLNTKNTKNHEGSRRSKGNEVRQGGCSSMIVVISKQYDVAILADRQDRRTPKENPRLDDGSAVRPKLEGATTTLREPS
jgi:hypothetical protein